MRASRSGFAAATSRPLPASRSLLQPDRARAGARRALETLCACAAALNVQLAAFVEAMPGADLPRDIEHLRRQNLVVATAQAGGWTAIPEATLDEGRWSRSIDVLLSRAARREAAVVEIWDLLLDGGEAMRGLAAKVQALRAQLDPAWRVQGLLLVRANAPEPGARARSSDDLFRATYPAASSAWLRALDGPRHADARGGWFRLDQRGWHPVGGRTPLAADPSPMQHSIAWTSR